MDVSSVRHYGLYQMTYQVEDERGNQGIDNTKSRKPKREQRWIAWMNLQLEYNVQSVSSAYQASGMGAKSPVQPFAPLI